MLLLLINIKHHNINLKDKSYNQPFTIIINVLIIIYLPNKNIYVK